MKNLKLLLFALIAVSCVPEFSTTITCTDEYQLILHVDTEDEAKVIQAKYYATGQYMDFFECPDGFCFEVDEEDIILVWKGRRVLDRNYLNQIDIYCLDPIYLNGEKLTIGDEVIHQKTKQ